MKGKPVNAIKGKQGFQKTGRKVPSIPTAGAPTGDDAAMSYSTMPHPDDFDTLNTVLKKVRHRGAGSTTFTPAGGRVIQISDENFRAFDTNNRLVGEYPDSDSAFHAAEAYASGQAEGSANDGTWPTLRDDFGDTGQHPVYGGRHWGVRYQENWDDYAVNHGYYGVIDERDDGVYVDYSTTPLADNEVRWTSDQSAKWDAEIVWQHREFITEGLRARGYSPVKGVRLSTSVRDTYIKVSDYDRPDSFPPFRVPLRYLDS